MTTLHFLSMNLKSWIGDERKKHIFKNIEDILIEKKTSVFFGQQGEGNLKIQNTELLGYVGTGRTCMIYDKSKIVAEDEKQYKQYIRDMELAGIFPKSYLPECNYILCKMTSRVAAHQPPFQFIAICWVTEEGIGEVRSTSVFRKLCSFIDNLSKWEGLPVIATGTFRITLKDAVDLVPTKFHCVGYTPPNKRTVFHSSNFFISSNDMVLQDVGPLDLRSTENREPTQIGHLKRFPGSDSPVMATLVILEELKTIEEFCTPVDSIPQTFLPSVSEDSCDSSPEKDSSKQYSHLAAFKRCILGMGDCCTHVKHD